MDLTNKVAIVTGATSGIGRGISVAFAKAGAKIVLCGLGQSAGEATLAMIRAEGGEAVFLEGDVTDPACHARLVEAATGTFGRLDICVNNAGLSTEPKPLADLEIADWEKVLNVNLRGVFLGMKAQIPALLANGGGSIVNIASIGGIVGVAGIGHYTASKHGVVGLTKTAAIDYAPRGVRVNAIGPGYIETELLNHYPVEERAKLGLLHPMGRLGKVPEVASLALFLASDSASFITGTYIPVDGGYTAR